MPLVGIAARPAAARDAGSAGRLAGGCPVSVVIRILGSSDLGVLDRVDPGVFDHSVDPDLAAEFLSDSRHHLAVALDGDMVVGMASAVHYVHPDKPAQLWVNEVGVAPGHRPIIRLGGSAHVTADARRGGHSLDAEFEGRRPQRWRRAPFRCR